jgi:hypothetical protein
MVDMAVTGTIATSFPHATQSGLYAHGTPSTVRKFLYEERDSDITVQLPKVDERVRPMLDAAAARLNAILAGFSARGCAQHDLLPQRIAAVNAIKVVYTVAPRVPAQIFPLPGGGVQIEWHHGPLDIEIEALGDGSLYIYLAHNKTSFIDEQVTGGQRIAELLERVRKELDNATAGLDVERRAIYS